MCETSIMCPTHVVSYVSIDIHMQIEHTNVGGARGQ